jgi:hypothetical protein
MNFTKFLLASNTGFMFIIYRISIRRKVKVSRSSYLQAELSNHPGRNSKRMTITEHKKQGRLEEMQTQAVDLCLFYQGQVQQAFGACGHMASLKLEVIQDIAPLHAPTSQPHQPPSPARLCRHIHYHAGTDFIPPVLGLVVCRHQVRPVCST